MVILSTSNKIISSRFPRTVPICYTKNTLFLNMVYMAWRIGIFCSLENEKSFGHAGSILPLLTLI